jgi:thiamine biosynthesis lipoprotein
MENEGRRRALKFFVTACVISAMYYFVMENIMPAVEVDGGSRVVMGTSARIVAVAQNDRKAKNAIKAGFDELTRINRILSEDSNKVNREAFAGPVKVSPELFEVLQTGIDYSKLTKGAFYITVADSNVNGGYEKLVLDSSSQTVRFAAAGMQLDLGGIGKGYAVDKAVEIMKRKGAIGGLVDAEGNIRCFGKPARGGNWLIEISPQRPLRTQRDNEANTANEPGMVLKLRDMAVATKLSGVTIIAPKATEADIIASAVNALGSEKGLDLVDSLLGVEAIIVTPGPEGRVIKSNGADAYLQ